MAQNDSQRLLELQSMRARNLSGVDMQSAARALAQNAVQNPTAPVYAYGLSPEQVLAVSQGDTQFRQNRLKAAQQMAGLALEQDNLAYQQAVKAQDMLMEEKKFALDQQITGLQAARLQLDMENDQIQRRTLSAKARQAELEVDALEDIQNMTVGIPNPRAGQTIVNEDGSPQLDPSGKPLIEPKEQEISIPAYLAAGGKLSSLRGGSQEQKWKTREDAFTRMGFSQDGARYLSMTSIESLTDKAITKANQMAKALEDNVATDVTGRPVGAPDYGTINGKAVSRNQFIMSQVQDYLRKTVGGMLGPEDFAILEKSLEPEGVSFEGAVPDAKPEGEAYTSEQLEMLLQRLSE